MAWNQLKKSIQDAIKANGNQEITGQLLQSILLMMVNDLGAGASFEGMAEPNTIPAESDGKMYYFAIEQGYYVNFNNFHVVEGQLAMLYYNGEAWYGRIILDASNGATFTPHVAQNGDLSWTNDQDLPNPETVNILGPAPVMSIDADGTIRINGEISSLVLKEALVNVANAITNANQAAENAGGAAASASGAASLANEKAELAAQKAQLANEAAAHADEQRVADHAVYEQDHAQAGSDHTRAEQDHTTAANDHTTAGQDHTQAGSDHTQAGSDHTRAEQDHTTAGNDHTTAGQDHTQAGSDHTRAEQDHTTAGNDHTRAEQDHTTAANDHTQFVNFESGTYPNFTAGDITPDIDTLKDVMSLFDIQTTGGYNDIADGDSEFIGVKGTLNPNYEPFLADQFISTSMNLVDPTKYLTINDKKCYYFPVCKGEWGEYGTSNKNNGFIVLGGTPSAVYFSNTKPTTLSYGSACTTHTDHGNTYYLPSSKGWLIIQMDDDTVPACHIVWNNEMDEEAGEFENQVKNLTPPHAWGWASLSGPDYSVFDETNARDAKQYPRIERILLGDIAAGSWSVSTETGGEGGTTTYIYKYTLPTASSTKMKPNGLWKSNYAGLEVDHVEGKLVVRSTTITTAADLVTALSGKVFFYELNTVTPVAIASDVAAALLANTANNFGLSYFLLDGELVSSEAWVMEAFYQTGKGQLFDGLAQQSVAEEVAAQSLNELNARLVSLLNKANSGDLLNTLILSIAKSRRGRRNFVNAFKLQGSGSPITAGIVPEFVGQEYYDTTNKVKYEAFGISAASDWVPMNS